MGPGRKRFKFVIVFPENLKKESYQKVKREQEEKPCVRKIIDNNKGEN